jgi:hypothetical protein
MTIYIEKDIFEKIIFYQDESFPNLKKIFCQRIDICIDLNDSELILEFENEKSPISILYADSQSFKKPIALKSYFEQIKHDKDILRDNSTDMFLLNICEQEALNLQSKFGVLVISSENLKDNFCFGGYSRRFEKGEVVKNSWKGIFVFPTPPYSAIIISDQYLFSNAESEKNLGIVNSIILFNALLPEKIDIPFHITIISDNAPPNSRKPPRSLVWWTEKFDELSKDIRSLRTGYEIKIELFLCKTIHKRVLLTNYSYGWTDKGFDIFKNSDSFIVHNDNDFHFHPDFNNLYDYGETYFKLKLKDLKELKQKCLEASKIFKKENPSLDCLVYGDVDGYNNSKNRLFD